MLLLWMLFVWKHEGLIVILEEEKEQSRKSGFDFLKKKERKTNLLILLYVRIINISFYFVQKERESKRKKVPKY